MNKLTLNEPTSMRLSIGPGEGTTIGNFKWKKEDDFTADAHSTDDDVGDSECPVRLGTDAVLCQCPTTSAEHRRYIDRHVLLPSAAFKANSRRYIVRRDVIPYRGIVLVYRRATFHI